MLQRVVDFERDKNLVRQTLNLKEKLQNETPEKSQG
jgi:hypothetical protein